jgi:hypothetical protein
LLPGCRIRASFVCVWNQKFDGETDQHLSHPNGQRHQYNFLLLWSSWTLSERNVRHHVRSFLGSHRSHLTHGLRNPPNALMGSDTMVSSIMPAMASNVSTDYIF